MSTLTAKSVPLAALWLVVMLGPLPKRQSVRAAVDELRLLWCSPIAFIDSRGDEFVTLEQDSKPALALAEIAAQAQSYRYEVISGRPVLYPSSEAFQRHLDHVNFIEMPRLAASDAYIATLRDKGILPELLLTPVVGDPEHPIYSEKVSVRSEERVIDQLIDLLGNDQALYLEFRVAPSGRQYLQFSRLRCSRGNRDTAVN